VTAGFPFAVAFCFFGSGWGGAAAAFFTVAFAGALPGDWIGFFAAARFGAAFLAGFAREAAGAVLAGLVRFDGAGGLGAAVVRRFDGGACFFAAAFAGGAAAGFFLEGFGLLFTGGVFALLLPCFFDVAGFGFAALPEGAAARTAFFAGFTFLLALPAGLAAAFRSAAFGVAAAGLLLLRAVLLPPRLAAFGAGRGLFFVTGFFAGALFFAVFPAAGALPAVLGLLTLGVRFAGVLLLVDFVGALAPLGVLLPPDRFAFAAGMNPPRLRELAVKAIVAAS
jgi:hypothetical protein